MYTFEEQDNGELVVKNESLGVWQTIPNIPRPYNLIRLPSNNNIYGVRDFADFDGYEFEFIKVVT